MASSIGQGWVVRRVRDRHGGSGDAELWRGGVGREGGWEHAGEQVGACSALPRPDCRTFACTSIVCLRNWLCVVAGALGPGGARSGRGMV